MSIVNIDAKFGSIKEPLLDQQPDNQQNHMNLYNYEQDHRILEVAEIHGKAKRVYTNRTFDNNGEKSSNDFCPCCNLLRQGTRLPICANLSQLYHLGTGYALYFKLLKYAILLLLLIFITGGTYNALTNFTGNNCGQSLGKDYCANNLISTFGIGNKRDQTQELKMQLFLNLMTVIVIILYIQYVRHELRRTESIADAKTISPSDYTVKITGDILEDKDFKLKEWLRRHHFKNRPLEVRKVTRAYDISDLEQKERDLEASITTKSEKKEQGATLNTKKETKEATIKTKYLDKDDFNTLRTAFVSFQSSEQADEIVKHFNRTLSSQKTDRKVKGVNLFSTSAKLLDEHKMKIARAPEPSDILWENLAEEGSTKFIKRLKTNTLAVLMVLLGFIFMVVISAIQKNLVDKLNAGDDLDNTLEIQIITYFGAILTTSINYFLGMFIAQMVDYEKRSTQTSYFKGVATKLSISQLINTAFTTLFAKMAVTVYYTEGGIKNVNLEDFYFYAEGGVLEAMFSLFITDTYFSPLYNLFDPYFLYKTIRNSWIKNKIQKDPSSNELDKKATYALFEKENYDLSYKHAMLIKTVLATCFFAPALPAVLLAGALGLALMYWINKYLLLRRAALPPAIGAELTNAMVEYLQWAAFMYAVGNAFFYNTLQRSDLTLAFSRDQASLVWIGVLLSFINVVLPMEYINRTLFKIDEEDLTEKTYDEVKAGFYTSYRIENPVTRKKALDKFKAKIEKARAKKRKNSENASLICRDSRSLTKEQHLGESNGIL